MESVFKISSDMKNDGGKVAKEKIKCLCLQTSILILFIVYVERSSGAAVNEKAREEKHQMYRDALSALYDGCEGGERMKGCRGGGGKRGGGGGGEIKKKKESVKYP